jgi:hypothetical protein
MRTVFEHAAWVFARVLQHRTKELRDQSYASLLFGESSAKAGTVHEMIRELKQRGPGIRSIDPRLHYIELFRIDIQMERRTIHEQVRCG